MSKQFILFLDESGDSNLKNIDPNYPVFVLGGIIVDANYYTQVMCPLVTDFKDSLFGKGTILHTREITRNKGRFSILKDKIIRQYFYTKINSLMEQLEFHVIASVIKKDKLASTYNFPRNPYELALEFLIERFYFFLNDREAFGTVIAEARDSDNTPKSKGLDVVISSSFTVLVRYGNRYLSGASLMQHINSTISIEKKAPDNIGLQVADLIVTPIGRHVIGKNTHEDFSIIEKKFLRRGNIYDGVGLKIFPIK